MKAVAFDLYKSAIQQLCPMLTVEEWTYLKMGLQLKYFPAKNYFIQAGEIQRTIGFIIEGLVRVYYIDAKGSEITIRFNKERAYVTDYATFIAQRPSNYYFQCLEPTYLLLLSYQHIQEGYEKYRGIEHYGRLMAEEVLKRQQKRIDDFQFYNAEQRYLKFLEENPNLFNRVSLTHLASYLGVERPSLSRIRKKIANR